MLRLVKYSAFYVGLPLILVSTSTENCTHTGSERVSHTKHLALMLRLCMVSLLLSMLR